MKVYDSANLPVQALAVGATVVLTAVAQGTPVPDKTISGTATRFAISNPTLQWQGRDPNKYTSTITLNAVVNGNALTIGGKVYTAGTEFTVGGNDAATAVNLAAAINLPIMEAQAPWIFNDESANIQFLAAASSGNVTCTADVEESLDGVNWSVAGTSPMINASAAPSVQTTVAVTKRKPMLRVRPLTLSGTGARLQVWIKGAPSL